MNDVHFSSKSNEWVTPQDFFDRLHAEFAFTIDAAASAENSKCERFWTAEDDGLRQDWSGERVWCNPPYGREVGKWIAKAATSNAELVVMLIPARTDTKAWHEYIFGKAEVRFIPGRLKFGGGRTIGTLHSLVQSSSLVQKDAPFACAVVVFK
jgi:phage N-6-adenine-methyltransferase